MIKKTIILVLILITLSIPNAYANDGGSRPDDERVSFEFALISENIQIGEPFEFTIKVTNHMSREAELISFDEIFYKTSDTKNADINDIIIDPYSTKELKITYIIPANINWYETDGEYYADFSPDMFYWAKEVLDGEPTDYPGYDEDDDYWDYVQDIDICIPLKITNLTDGSHLAEISVVDTQNFIKYSDILYHERALWNGQIACMHTSEMCIDNFSYAPLEEVYVYQYYYKDRIENQTIKPEKTYFFQHQYFEKAMPEDIQRKKDINFRAVFSMDNQYYCINTSRTYNVNAYDLYDRKIIITPEPTEFLPTPAPTDGKSDIKAESDDNNTKQKNTNYNLWLIAGLLVCAVILIILMIADNTREEKDDQSEIL